jgi:hypothetical protein
MWSNIELIGKNLVDQKSNLKSKTFLKITGKTIFAMKNSLFSAQGLK